jgi:hypothetical protein
MIPEVGTTCLFSFSARFSTLNGVYRIRATTTFSDALSSGVDFVEHLYTPAGLSQADFDTDYRQYNTAAIAVLESVVDTSVVYYVPESLFLNTPDPTVREYLPLILTVELGVFENTQVIFPLLDQLKDLVQASLGITSPLRVMANPQNKAYLTESQYRIIEEGRSANIKALVPLSVQLKKSQEDNAYLAALCAAYEQTLVQLGGTVPAP